MQYTAVYQSPIGEILLAADDVGLTGLWFAGAKYCALGLDKDHEERETSALTQAKCWLDTYFSGKEPDFTPSIHMLGTPFQLEVWGLLRQIPYGETTTYGQLAGQMAKRRGIAGMSAQAIGNAVGRNRLSLIIPCHRVVGQSGSLTGYAGGLDKKKALLKLEGAYREEHFLPKHSTAL